MGFSRQEYWSHALLQEIFLTQELNPDLLHHRQILYQLSYQGSPGSIGGVSKGDKPLFKEERKLQGRGRRIEAVTRDELNFRLTARQCRPRVGGGWEALRMWKPITV